MRRKLIKILSFFTGVAIILASILSQMPNSIILIVNRVYPFFIIGLFFICAAMIMHSKDIREKKKVLSGFLKGLAYFYLVWCGLGIIATILVRIILKFWIFQLY